MSETILFKLLDLIERKVSISTLFKLGYSYSNIIKWYFELESEGYVSTIDDEYKFLTVKGRNKLSELRKKRKYDIGKLEQYKIPKKPIEDIYLP